MFEAEVKIILKLVAKLIGAVLRANLTKDLDFKNSIWRPTSFRDNTFLRTLESHFSGYFGSKMAYCGFIDLLRVEGNIYGTLLTAQTKRGLVISRVDVIFSYLTNTS